MEFQLSYFKSWKMMLWKCCTQYTSKYGKLSNVHGPEEVSFHSNPKECSNYSTTVLILHASKVMLKILQARLQQYMNRVHELQQYMNFLMFKLVLEKAEEPGSNYQHPLDHRKSKRVPENIYFCFIDYAKAFDCVDYNKLWKTLQEMGIPDTSPASCQTCMQVKK